MILKAPPPILALGAALVSALTLSGCRFGNRVVKADDPAALSGFYSTEARSMSICAYIDGDDWRCAEASTSMIPSSIESIMTNPVYVSANSSRAKAYLVANTLDTSSYFEMDLGTDGALSAELAVGQSSPFWLDEGCLNQMQLGKEGRLIGAAAQQSGDFELSGSLEFSIAVITALSGSCTTTLEALRACHLDADKCPGATAQERTEEQQSVQDFFAPYIDHGVLTVDEIPQAAAFGWEASYH